MKYMEKAVSLKNVFAFYKIGEYYHDLQNYSLAIKFYKKGVEKGNHSCIFNLAVMYRDGEHVKQNYKKAINLFTESLFLGNKEQLRH